MALFDDNFLTAGPCQHEGAGAAAERPDSVSKDAQERHRQAADQDPELHSRRKVDAIIVNPVDTGRDG